MRAKIGLVCPAYGYPGFLPELAASILKQKTSIPFCAVLVDDCCPDPETVEVCNEFAFAYPETFHYVRPAGNKGLSSTRNAGVDYLLSAFPGLEGITFLDADDRIFPLFIERAYEALRSAISRHDDPASRVGWVFEDPYMFGVPGIMRRLRKHSLLWNMVGATQTSSSIMSADMFRCGLRYAEDMKTGGEDWEFSLRAYKAGFRAYFKPMLGFRYRRRPGSMSSSVSATLGMERNRVDIRLRHPDLYRVGPVVEQYARECRHYCLIDENGRARLQAGAEDEGEELSLQDLLRLLSNNYTIPGIPAPQHFIFAHSYFLSQLRARKRLRDFYSRVNAFTLKNRRVNHVLLPPPEQPWNAERVQRFLRETPGEPENIDRIGAVTLTRESFLSSIDKHDAVRKAAEDWVLNWTFPQRREPPSFRANRIFKKTVVKARSAWRGGVKPAQRIKEQSWKPGGMEWRDLPQMLTGLNLVFPEPANRRGALLVTRGEDLTNPKHLQEFIEFVHVFRHESTRCRLALAIVDDAVLLPGVTDFFDDVYLLPRKLDRRNSLRWNDEKLVLSIAASFGRVISIGTTRLNDHTAALRKNGVQLFHKLYKGSGDFEHGRTLVTMFKAYNGFISKGGEERTWLISHGVPEEIILSYREFQSAISSR